MKAVKVCQSIEAPVALPMVMNALQYITIIKIAICLSIHNHWAKTDGSSLGILYSTKREIWMGDSGGTCVREELLVMGLVELCCHVLFMVVFGIKFHHACDSA